MVPTPTIAPVIVCVVETGMPAWAVKKRVAAAAVSALIPATPAEDRWVNYAAAALAAFWAILLALEVVAGRGRGERSAGL